MAKQRAKHPAPRLGPGDLLWSYSRLARLYGLGLVGVAGGLLILSVILEATSEDGWSWAWLGVVAGMTGITGLIFFPLLRVWLRRGGLPSIHLPDAVPADGPRRLEAAPSDWRRWGGTAVVVLFIASAAMLVFLIAVLGRGGTAEGVVVGMLAAWGLVTLEDGRRITTAEGEQGRSYWAVGHRPTGAGNRLMFTTRGKQGPVQE